MFSHYRSGGSRVSICIKAEKYINTRQQVELPQWKIMPVPGKELIYVCLFLHLCISTEQVGSHSRDFHKILHWGLLLNSVEKI
jgi:hypothetical protein